MMKMTLLIRSILVVVVLLGCRQEREVAVSAFLPMPSSRIKMTKKKMSTTSLFYQDNSTDIATSFTANTATTTNFGEDSSVTPAVGQGYKNNYCKASAATGLSFGRREVDRYNVHPIYKLGWIPEEVPLNVIATMVVLFSPLLILLLPMIVALRKKRWEELQEKSKQIHKSAFEETTLAYRQSQRILVDRLLMEEQQKQHKDKHNPLSLSKANAKADTVPLPQVIAVTMATGQEGQGVVRGLVEAPQFQNITILALVRNPNSHAAQALAKLSPRIRLVECDSTDTKSLRRALEPAEAVFLATTLNQASAGQWNMEWDGGQYQVQQGKAFAEACSGLPSLRQIVYGTAPMRKWPESFVVEPPIHYAAKWRVEQLLMEANLPVTFLRKCPYHENFTKLTKGATKKMTTTTSRGGETSSTAAAAMGVEGGGAFDVSSRKIELEKGQYQIKAMTPPNFTYNMMDPRDIGKWAALAFSNPSILIGESLSVASDALTGPEMASAATECGAFGEGVTFAYSQQPRWLFEVLAFVEPTFVYISGLQRWNIDGGLYDLDADGVEHARKLVMGSTWSDHLEREGLGQFTETMEDLLPDYTKVL